MARNVTPIAEQLGRQYGYPRVRVMPSASMPGASMVFFDAVNTMSNLLAGRGVPPGGAQQAIRAGLEAAGWCIVEPEYGRPIASPAMIQPDTFTVFVKACGGGSLSAAFHGVAVGIGAKGTSRVPAFILIDGQRVGVTDALSSGPPTYTVHSYNLVGGGYVEKIAGRWTRHYGAFQRIPPRRVTVELP